MTWPFILHVVFCILISQKQEKFRCFFAIVCISDEKLLKKFSLVDSEGNDITEGQQLGLLLYRGGTVCNEDQTISQYYFLLDYAMAICKEMNFTHALRWTVRESFDIQSNYDIYLMSVKCSSAEWESCRFDEDTRSCEHSQDIFLSCGGAVLFHPI